MNYSYILPRKRWYTQQRSIRRAAAALILAGGVLLGGALWPRAEAVENEPERVGFLLITGQVPQTEEPRHPVLTFRASDPALCAGIEAPEEEGPSQSAAAAALPNGKEAGTSPEEPIAPGMASQGAAAQEEAEPEEVRTYLGEYKITGYDICPSCCGNTKGITASGTTATVGRTCAAPKDLPFGTRLWIEGIGERIVEDRGGAVNGKKIDVLCADHPACYAITGTYEVYIISAEVE